MRKIVATLVILLCIVGCAAKGPKLADIESSIPPIPAGSGRIFFLKPGYGSARIAIDKREIGSIKYGAFFWEDLPAANYHITVDDPVNFGSWDQSLTVLPGIEHFLEINQRTGQRVAGGLFGPIGLIAEAATATSGRSGTYQIDIIDSSEGRKKLGELVFSREGHRLVAMKPKEAELPNQEPPVTSAKPDTTPLNPLVPARAPEACSLEQVLSMTKAGLSDAQVKAACR
jgi:hypothetical protein